MIRFLSFVFGKLEPTTHHFMRGEGGASLYLWRCSFEWF